MTKQQQPWILLSLVLGFYCLDFFFRISQSIVLQPLIEQYNTTPLGIGGFASAFYLAYLVMQLPAGILLDKLPFTRLYAAAIFISVFAFIAFVLVKNYWLGYTLRLIVGGASALSFIGLLFLARCYFAPKYFSIIAGITIGLGTLAASAVQALGSWLINYISWQVTFVGIGILGLVFGLLLLHPGLRLPPIASEYRTNFSWQKLAHLFCQRRAIMNAIVGGLFYLPTTIFAVAWGVAFLQQDYHLSRTIASLGTLCLFLGWAVGSPFMGIIASRVKHYHRLIIAGSAIALLLSLILIYTTFLGKWVLALLFLIGLVSSAQTVIWKVFYDDTPQNMTGIGASFTNMVIMLCDAVFHLIVGLILGLGWLSTAGGHLNYQLGLSIIPLAFAAVCGLAWLTYRRNSHDS